MQPDTNKINIGDNIVKIEELLAELVLAPRINLIKWSGLTKQTPNIRIGYPGQHLASLITGITGEKTGARGHDLADGSEVKSCSRIDQLDQCKNCKSPVARLETACSVCNSVDIKRNNDSKWLFSVRSELELDLITHKVPRVLLVLGDYPHFDTGDYSTLRFQAFEVWPQHQRNIRFSEIMSNYYHKIYLAHKLANPNSNPAPKNFWPYQYQFYLCNPIRTFACTITEANTAPKIKIEHYLPPEQDRSTEPSLLMPAAILKEPEIDAILSKAAYDDIQPLLTDRMGSKEELISMSYRQKIATIKGIDEKLRAFLPLRDTDRISAASEAYTRRPVI